MSKQKRLIDANELMRRICGAKCGCEHEECGSEGDCVFEHFIFGAPTIDPESLRPVGEWEWYEEWQECTTDSPAECQCAGWMCSKCGIDLAEYLNETTHENMYLDDPEWQPQIKFCPNCGARMEDGNG